MAGTNNYKLVVQAELDPSKIEAQVKALGGKNILLMKMQLDPSGQKQFDDALAKIQEKAKSVGKISFFADENGKTNKAVVDYTNQMNQAVKATILLGNELKVSEVTTKNLAQEAKELSNAYLNAEKFLAKSANMDMRNPSVASAVGTAQQIKVAVSDGDINKVRELNNQLAIQKASLSGVKSGIDSWTAGLKNAIKQTIEYSVSIGLVYGALNQIKEGIQYIKDLNKELTNIQLVTGDTDANTAKLAVTYNNLAKETGATTIEVAKGALEWVRQGKTAEETGVLLKNSLMLSKLGNMESADATERLTSIMNGFKLKAEETTQVVDKLVALDNAYATSVDEISTAMKFSSNSAQQAGVDFNHLAAYITVVSSTTRQSSETIGQAFKTMFARFTDIKAGKIDEDGLGINNVETALARVNISLRDSKNSFRDIQDVIKDVSDKWSSLSEVEQDNIAKSIAGVRQKEQFLVLMTNQQKIQQALNIEEKSSNLAKERYAIYLKSIEASQNKLTASWEAMVSSAATKDMITSFYNGATAVLDMVNALGGIPTILKIAIPLLIAYNAEWLKTQLIAKSNFITTIISDIQGLIVGLQAVNPAMAETAIIEGEVSTGAQAMSVSLGTATLGLTLIAGALIWATAKTIELKHAQDDILQGLKDGNGQIVTSARSYQEYIKNTEDAAKASGYLYDEQGRLYHEGYHGLKVYTEGMQLLSESQWEGEKAGDAFDRAQGRVNSTVKDGTGYVPELTKTFSDFATTLKEVGDTTSTIDDLLSNYMKNGLSVADAAKIPPEYLDALSVEGDKLTLNIDLIKQKELASVKATLQATRDAEATGQATSQQVAVIEQAYNQLLAESQRTYGEFGQTASQYEALIWNIANQAIAAGYTTFKDTQGNALNSAQQIHDYMMSSSSSFNNFVQQVATATGKTVEQVTSIINGMINNTINGLNSLGGMSGGLSPDERDEAKKLTKATPLISNVLFPSTFSPSNIGSGGGGGSSSGNTQAEDRAKKIQDDIENARKSATNDLKDQLSLYKDIIDARKKILDTMSDERKYTQDVDEKNKEILKVQTELNALQFDNSQESAARRLELQDQLSGLQKDLSNINYDQSAQRQKDALDADYKAFETQLNSAIKSIEGISANSVGNFASQLATILAGLQAPPVPQFHSGAEMGVVGKSMSLKSNEIFAKLMAGEVVSTPEQISTFMGKTLPQMVQGSSSIKNGDISIDMPIQVAGNLDKSTLPALEEMIKAAIKQLNKNMSDRGYTRTANQFSV